MAISLGQAESIIAAARKTAAELGETVSPLVGGPRQSGTNSLVPNGGGVIIRVGGTVIGALGVSGAGSSITDHKIGTAAVARLD